MNTIFVLNQLKAKNMISTTQEGIALFSDCFNKFGISLLLLNDNEKFSEILDILVENKIPLQKSNGIYNFRIFAVEAQKIKEIIADYKEIGELNFLRQHPDMIPAEQDIHIILENMKYNQKNDIFMFQFYSPF